MNYTGFMDNENMIERIVQLMAKDDSQDAPARAVKWAKNIFRTRVAEPKRSLVERIVAVLQFDLAPDRAAFGERSAATGNARQMLFAAGKNSVDLRIGAAGRRFTINGQILGEGFEGARVTLLTSNRELTSVVNENLEFGFEKIPAGTYRMAIEDGERSIEIEGIEVG